MIVVIVSAGTEWKVVRERYPEMAVRHSPFGEWFEVAWGEKSCGRRVVFFHGGWGKVKAAASTQFVIDTLSPDLLINIGTCGGFAGQASVGDILLVEKTVIHDIYERMFDPEEAIAEYCTTLELDWVGDLPSNVKRSLLISGDGDLDPKRITALRDKFHAIAGDWESGAIAHVCDLNGVRCLILRGVSDLVSELQGEAYEDPQIFISRTTQIMNALLDSLPGWINRHERD